MRDFVQIVDNKHLVRDIQSKAILNTDKAGLDEYLMKRQIALKQQSEKIDTNNRLEKLEQDMSEIKSLLMDIAKMRNGNGD
jgi:hypothetical protein